MKLSSLYFKTPKRDVEVLKEYLEKLKDLQFRYGRKRVLAEAKITITIDSEEKAQGIPDIAKSQFIEQAKSIGNFENSDWVRQLINGMKQVGVQGFNEITEDEKPVTQREMKTLIGLLINLLNSK